jgi:hypothetical protein
MIIFLFLLFSCNNTPIEDSPPYSSGLALEVSIAENLCKDYKEPIDVVFMFTNNGAQVIRIPDLFLISHNRRASGGNIVAKIYYQNDDIYTLRDNSMMDVPWPNINTFIEIHPYETLKKIIQYKFPSDILESKEIENEVVVTPSPGIYRITFTYYQVETTYSNWQGYIESNAIEVCLQ